MLHTIIPTQGMLEIDLSVPRANSHVRLSPCHAVRPRGEDSHCSCTKLSNLAKPISQWLHYYAGRVMMARRRQLARRPATVLRRHSFSRQKGESDNLSSLMTLPCLPVRHYSSQGCQGFDGVVCPVWHSYKPLGHSRCHHTMDD